MFTGQLAVISNRATWLSDTIELEDDEDGSTIDLASPDYTVAISVYIKDENDCHRLTGTLDNGKVVIDGPGFHWQFEDSDLHQFCAGTYKCGVKVTINGFITDLIIGDVAIVEGN
ncbi:hypothetical protein ABIB94_007093 [Bradyrhizobium sp. JR7.2]|uniref:hypothetical protein n=1 Tax=Bradyrhizobium sp. JR7.2 TaxID=3156375 RepID=UPI0033940AD5